LNPGSDLAEFAGSFDDLDLVTGAAQKECSR
jgi:hypothetical protein